MQNDNDNNWHAAGIYFCPLSKPWAAATIMVLLQTDAYFIVVHFLLLIVHVTHRFPLYLMRNRNYHKIGIITL